MAIEYSLDQRRYRLNLSKKELFEICSTMGVDLKYDTICCILDNQERARHFIPEKVDLLRAIMRELEEEQGIADIYFDER